MRSTGILFAKAVLGLSVLGLLARDGVNAQEGESTRGVNPASEEMAENEAVRSSWEDGGCRFEARPEGEEGSGREGSVGGRGGSSNARKPWVVRVYNYEGTQLLLTLRLGGLGNKPAVRAAKAITQAVAFLQQRTSRPGAEVRLSFDSGVVVLARSHD